MARFPTLLPALLLCLALPGVASAQADTWPTVRHDAWRRNAATGQGIITRPAVQARLPTGTSIGARALSHTDIDGDGVQEILLIDAGRAIARDQQDRLIWDTANLGFTEIHGVYDFDGDGVGEVLALGNLGLAILDARTGLVLWRKSDFSADNNQTHDRNTKVGDVDGDGLPEVIVKAHFVADESVHAYSFKDGYHEDPDDNELWVYALQGYKQGVYPVVGDVDDDGVPEVLSIGLKGFETIDAVTGQGELLVPDVGVSQAAGPTYIVQLDDDPQLEAVRIAKQAGQGMAVTVFDFVRTPGGLSASLAWDPAVVRIDVPFECIGDMDGDGRPEIVINRWDGEDWNLTVLQYHEGQDGDGNPTASLSIAAAVQGPRVRGLVDLDGDGRYEAITETTQEGDLQFPPFSTIELFTFDGDQLESQWHQDATSVVTGWHPIDLGSNGFLSAPPLVTLDVHGDGHRVFIAAVDHDGDLYSDAIVALNAAGEPVYELPFEGDEALSPIRAGADLSGVGAGPELLIEVGESLSIASAQLSLGSPRITTAAFEPESLVVDLDGDARSEIVFQRASGNIRAWEASGPLGVDASFTDRWLYPRATGQYPVFVDLDKDGSLEAIFRYTQERTTTTFEILDADGEEWGSLKVFEAVNYDPMVADLNKDGVDDLIAFYVEGAEEYAAMAIDGATLTFLWDAPLPGTSHEPYQENGLAVDVNGDGTLDVCMAMDSGYFGCLSGVDGKTVRGATTSTNRGAVMVGQADDDEPRELFFVNHNGFRRYSLDLVQEWAISRAEGEATNWGTNTFILRGALGDINGDGHDEIFAAAATERLYRIGPDGSTGFIRYLRGGEVLSVPGDPTTSPQLSRCALGDVDGDGALEVLVGSGDGWLYAIDGATGSKEWALPFTQRVGPPILADVDGDGKLEIVVTVGDGNVEVIDQAPLIAPAEVRDVPLTSDGQADAGSPDVDEVIQPPALAASWDPVEGAAGYSASVETENGSLAVEWTDVGAVTAATFEGFFVVGNTYYVNVAPYDATGALGETGRSDGVLIVAPPPTPTPEPETPTPTAPTVTPPPTPTPAPPTPTASATPPATPTAVTTPTPTATPTAEPVSTATPTPTGMAPTPTATAPTPTAEVGTPTRHGGIDTPGQLTPTPTEAGGDNGTWPTEGDATPTQPDGSSCGGCASSGQAQGGAAWGWLLLGLVGVRRRLRR